MRWLTTRGALLGGEVRAPADGPRGLFAARDHAAGETLGFVPFAAAVPVGRTGEPGLVAALARRAYDPHSPFFVNGSWAPFWRTQPPLADMLCGETISDALLAQLEAPAMEAAVREARAAHLADYTELQAELAAEQGLPAPALAEEEGQEQGSLPLLLSFGQYMHLAALTTTRAFAFHDEDGTCCTDWLLPGFDLLNTAPAGLLNAVRRHNDDDDVGGAWRVELRASRAVRAGEVRRRGGAQQHVRAFARCPAK